MTAAPPFQPACPPGFLDRFRTFSKIGSTGDGGVDRMEGTPANGEARRQVIAWLEELGFEPRVDAIGNIFGLLDLAGPDAPLIMVGSHIDSQPMGGCFDGAYGVIGAIEAAAAVREALAAEGKTAAANLAVVAWTGEEGARFRTFMGSRVYTGITDVAATLAQTDVQGITAGEALTAIGALGTDEAPAMPVAYVELHVECGSVLDDSGARLGIFDRWWGAHKLDIRFKGETSHTGPTPMAKRRDALYAAAQMITAVRDMGDAAPIGDLHTSVAKLVVLPNSPNVVPDAATGCVEIRSVKDEVIVAHVAKLMAIVEKAAEKANVDYDITRDDLRRPGTFDPGLVTIADGIARDIGIVPTAVATMAGHDAIMLAAVTRSLMLTVPSRQGLCHHPDEWTDPADLKLGVAWLTGVLTRLVTDPPTAE